MRPPRVPQAPGQRVAEVPRPALGDGEADRLGQRREQPAEQRAAGRLGLEVGVQRVAGQQQPAAGTRELLLARPAHRQHAETQERQHTGWPQCSGQSRRRAQRRERRQQRVDQPVADLLPATVQPAPGVAVAGRVGLAGRRGHPDVAVGNGRVGAPGGRVRAGERRAAPTQAVLLQAQRANRRRGHGQRVEGREQVGGEARLRPARRSAPRRRPRRWPRARARPSPRRRGGSRRPGRSGPRRSRSRRSSGETVDEPRGPTGRAARPGPRRRPAVPPGRTRRRPARPRARPGRAPCRRAARAGRPARPASCGAPDCPR